MLAIYEFLNDDFVKRINYDCNISKGSIYNIKKQIHKFNEEKVQPIRNIMIGGSKSVQIDENVIYKGRLETYTSNLSDNAKGCTWLVRLIEQDTGRMIIEIVPNRKIENMTNIIRKHVLVGSLVITDGHPSYPRS
ncbi:hypothetical protein DMUE_5940, partial [Dictyocoela muelleri]